VSHGRVCISAFSWALILEDSDGNKPVLTVGFFFYLALKHTFSTEDLRADRPHSAAAEGPFLVQSLAMVMTENGYSYIRMLDTP
jgi:hypothetical protein